MTFIAKKDPPDAYVCVRKVNNRFKETYCGPVFSLLHMLSNILEFDTEYVFENKIARWNPEVLAKVYFLNMYTNVGFSLIL